MPHVVADAPEQQPLGDYIVPRAGEPIALDQRRHIILALICVLSFPLCLCSFRVPANEGVWDYVLVGHMVLVFLTFGLPLLILGRGKSKTPRLLLVKIAVAIFVVTLVSLILQLSRLLVPIN